MRRFIMIGSSILGSGCVLMIVWTLYLGRYELAVVNVVSLAMNIVMFTIAKTSAPLRGPTRW